MHGLRGAVAARRFDWRFDSAARARESFHGRLNRRTATALIVGTAGEPPRGVGKPTRKSGTWRENAEKARFWETLGMTAAFRESHDGCLTDFHNALILEDSRPLHPFTTAVGT